MLCQDSAPATLDALRALNQHPAARLLVATPRPQALWLQERSIPGQTQALHAVLAQGQGGKRKPSQHG